MAINDLVSFIRLVAPYQVISGAHEALCKWFIINDNRNRLVLWPRDHGKSRYAAFYAAWEIVRDPSTTIIYASATAEKAEEQLRFIKSIIDSKVVAKYFPGLLAPLEGNREAWNKTYIIVDHPYRKTQGVVDSTIMTCGLEKTITGKHCKRLILDDVVVPENNNETGRKDVNSWVAQAASITSADSTILAVGTRYHPHDAYQVMLDMEAHMPVENEAGEMTTVAESMFEVSQADVEDDGEFLWPRQQRKDGKWFGFNAAILARKRAVYEANGAIIQFYAQYYNNPNDASTSPISRELFQYYEKEQLAYSMGLWSIGGKPLYVYAAMDLATSKKDSSDYTVIIVGGIDDLGNRYIMDIARFREDKISAMFTRIKEMYSSYKFKKLRIECVAGFKLAAEDIGERLYNEGIRIPIDYYVPPNTDGKVARVHNILEPLYQSRAMWHYRGGNCQILEDELVSINPSHDDTKDAWAMCVDLMELPLRRRLAARPDNVVFHPRFGGIA